MTLTELAKVVLPILVTALIPVLVGAISFASKADYDWFREKVKTDKLDKYYDMVNEAVVTAVAAVMQTFETTMKNSGGWDKDAAKKALKTSQPIARRPM